MRWLNQAQPLSVAEWQSVSTACKSCCPIVYCWRLTARMTWLIVLPEGEWRAVPPFAGEDNPVVMAVWHGPARGCASLKRS
jgi:glycogen operon protein